MPGSRNALLLCMLILGMPDVGTLQAADRYVSTTGSDSNPGTLTQPYLTIQKAVDFVVAGDTVHIRAGTYSERITIDNRDGTSGAPIVFQKYSGDSGAVIVTQAGVTPPDSFMATALLWIQDSDHITVRGLEFTDYKTSGTNFEQSVQKPAGIFVMGSGNGIKILNCKVHAIWQNITSRYSTTPGYGISVYGSSSTAINNLVIDGCEIYHLRTATSGSLVLNGNITNFAVTNNIIHECDNSGIDLIGNEGFYPMLMNRPRDGVVVGNVVYLADSSFNPADGGDRRTGGGGRSAAGIRVDGGRNIIIERNHVFSCNFGVEVGSKAYNTGFTEHITLRNNLLHHNDSAGLIMGGDQYLEGGTRFCTITGNTLYFNGTSEETIGQIALQFHVSDCSFRNNIVWAGLSGQMLTHRVEGGTVAQREFGANVTLDYNCYFCSWGSARFDVFKNGAQRSWTMPQWQAASGGFQQDANSMFCNPGFVAGYPRTPPSENPWNLEEPWIGYIICSLKSIRAEFALLPSSPVVNAGEPLFSPASAERDIIGQLRVLNTRVDIGAFEYGTSWQGWQEINFGVPPGANSGPEDDPDLDGVANLIEYSQGMNPNARDVQLKPGASVVDGNLRFSYRKVAGELTYTVEQNTTLPGTWTTLSTTEGSGNGLYWRDVPLNGTARFFRLVVTMP